MMKMSSTRSERPSKPGAHGNHIARFPPAALAEPPTPTVEAARETADAILPIDGSSICTTVKVKVTMVTRKLYTPVISKIILMFDFPDDYIMVRYIDQQGWQSLSDVITIVTGSVKDFFTVEPDGKFEAKPMLFHLRMFKAFLLFYKRKRRESLFKMT
jgi:hypothetical protein